MADDAGLLNQIYEAGAVPQLWPDALSAIAKMLNAYGAIVLAQRGDDAVGWLASPAFKPVVEDYFDSGFHLGNERTRRLLAAGYPGFLTDDDVFKPEERLGDPTYQQFWFRHGLGWGTATVIPVPSGDTLIVHAERRQVDGPFERELVDRLDSLRPHLARAALFSARLGLEHAHAMAAALQMLGLPAAVLRGKGRLFAANALFEALMPGVARDHRDRLQLVDPKADRLFADALMRVSLADKAAVNSVPVAACDGRSPHIVHVLPVRGAAHDIFAQATSLVVITPVDRAAVPGAKVLQGLFDLTPAEARLAGLIGQAKSPRQAALMLGIAEGTVRVMLKNVLAKTGMRRQAELVSLLSGVAPASGDRE
jgi:DNA-binding CsgD family transcriptional regulator